MTVPCAPSSVFSSQDVGGSAIGLGLRYSTVTGMSFLSINFLGGWDNSDFSRDLHNE